MNQHRGEASACNPIDHWVGHILRRARIANVVSLEQVAAPLGYSPAEWEACEYGMLRVDIVSLYRAAIFLGVEFPVLFREMLALATHDLPPRPN